MIDTKTSSDPIETATSPVLLALMDAVCKTPIMMPIEDMNPNSFIVLFNGVPHDIGPFMNDHPGGPNILRMVEKGTEISTLMSDESIHVHSALAYKLLAGMKKNIASEIHDDQNTQKSSFLDLSRPLVWQLLSSDKTITKADYLAGIHVPQFMHHSARLFESDFLESLSKTTWWVIPLIWIPIAIGLFIIGHTVYSTRHLLLNLGLVFAGIALWSFIEYVTHRFLFHIDATRILPDNKIFLVAHFFLHGIHHFMPMDPYRLVMPPIMTLILGSLIWGILAVLLPIFSIRVFICAGLLLGYVWYDLTHYHLHHYNEDYILSKILGPQESLRKKHNGHHYRAPDKGFGVSSSIWDHVFGTMMTVE